MNRHKVRALLIHSKYMYLSRFEVNNQKRTQLPWSSPSLRDCCTVSLGLESAYSGPIE